MSMLSAARHRATGGKENKQLTPVFRAVTIQRVVIGRAHVPRAVETIVDDLERTARILGRIRKMVE